VSALDELYREVILEHYRHPRNQGRLPDPDVATRGHNPLCGDDIELSMKVNDDIVSDIRFLGKGCSISQASASILTEAVKGKTTAQARALIDTFKAMMRGEITPSDELGDIEALQGVRKYPVRIKCALLAWTTLQEGLDLYARSQRS